MRIGSSLPRPPGPRGIPFVGNISLLWNDPLGNVLRLHRDYGDVIRLTYGPYVYYLVHDLDAIKHVLIDNNKNYVKSRNYLGLKLVLGDGLVTSDGDLWRRQRKLAQPAFLRKRIEAFADPIVRLTEEHLARWDRLADGASLDAHESMLQLTFRIVGRTLCSLDFGSEANRAGPLLNTLIHYANDYAEALVKLPTWLPLPRNIEFNRAKREIDRLVGEVIAARRNSGEAGEDLLGLLMTATDEEGRMSEKQLRDEVLTLVAAGHETTANTLSFTLYLLSLHPDIDRRVESEIDRVLGGRSPTIEDLPKLEYVERAIKESMRLYPPAWAFERDALDADTLAGYPIEKGATVGVATYSLHRHPDHWENPEGFDPDRFLPERSAARPRFAYVPFGAGPRQCIGMGMAMMEAALILATIRQRYRLDLVSGRDVTLDPSVTLRPRNGLEMRLRRRTRSAEGRFEEPLRKSS